MKKLGLILIFLAILVFGAGPAMANKATVIMTFDDGWRSVSDKAFPIMQNNSQVGVSFVYIPPIIGNYPDFMQKDRLDLLYNAGWDISSHTYDHVNLTTVNSSQLNFELSASLGWLNSNGYPRGAMILAYPEGAYNPIVIDAVKANHYAAARSVDPVNGSYPSYNLNSPDVFQMKAYETIGGTGPETDNASTVINQINNAIAVNGTLILVFHKIVDTYSTDANNASTEFLATDFQMVSDYIKSMSNENVDVTTLSSYLGTTPLPRFMPEMPVNISSTYGNNWINTSWNSGGNNKTDLYNINVNGTWFNRSINNFINITVSNGGETNVMVYAVNSTNGDTVNPVPAILNTTIQIYMPSVPINITATNGNVTNGSGVIYINWQDGIDVGGNKTDFYNLAITNFLMNGSLLVNKTNNSYNLSVIPGILYEVKIYAVNSTNGTTINQTPGIIDVIIPLYRPPTPIEIRQSSGNYWAYFEWTNGTGVNGSDGKTDLYNVSVNGVWTNLTTNKSVNVSSIGGVNVSVYAINSTNGGVQSYVPLDMNLINQIELGNIWARYDKFVGDTLRIVPTINNPANDTIRFTTNATLNATIDNKTGEFILNIINGDQGTYYWNITAYDVIGESKHTIDFMVVITNKPVFSGGGGNGGNGNSNGGGYGGGGSLYDPNAEFFEKRDSQIRNNANSTVEFFKNNLVKSVTFHGIRNYGEVTVKVAILKGNPKPAYLNNTYKFFSINLDMIQQNSEYLYIDHSSVIVRINKSSLIGNITKAYRYVNDQWVTVGVEDLNKDDGDAKEFKLSSNGLSNFVIVLEPIPIPEVIQKDIQVNLENASLTGNPTVDKVIKKIMPESYWRKIINFIKRYMWWI